MSGLEINTKKLGEIYKEWRGNESCYDNGRPVFEADELLDFAQFCLKHEANVIPTGEGQSNIPDVNNRYLIWRKQVVRLAVRGGIIRHSTKITNDFMKPYFDDGYSPASALDEEYGKSWRPSYNGC